MSTIVSIALCTFNGERFLAEQLDSVLQQTYSQLEVVIVDDCSSDGTCSVIEQYAQKDKRIRFYKNENNLGYNKNFEKAFSLCNGELIAIADQDDIWALNKIERMIDQWPGNSKFIFSLSGSFTDTDFEHRTEAPDVFYSDIDDTRKLVFNSPVHGHACMFRKEFLKECIPFPDTIFYDWWMSMHAASTGVVGCIPLTLTWHRVHSSNSSRTLTSIVQKQERLQKLRDQSATFIEKFFSAAKGKEQERTMLLKYATLLKQCDGKIFLWPMFWLVFQNRNIIFHYKKKPFVILSHLKHAVRMARNGLL